MKIVRARFDDEETARWAVDEGDRIVPLAGAPWTGPGQGAGRGRGRAEIVAPAAPSKIICVGRNYRAHAKELGHEVPDEPMLFLKPPSSIIGPDATIVRPKQSELVHHEGELAVVIGADGKDLEPDDAKQVIFGYTIANDVTARDIQRKETNFGRAKSFDTFCPLGPALVTADEVADPQALKLTVTVGDDERQSGETKDMIWSVAELVSFISKVMTLKAGDVILTGTPEGVGPLVAGDTVAVSITGLGTLSNPVADAE